MKLPTLLLAGSLAANAALVALFAFQPTFAPPAIRGFFSSAAGDATTGSAPASTHASADATKARAAAEAATWTSLHPDDLKGLVTKLRAAGFPPGVVRSVVQALISARFAPRLREIYGLDDNVPYWKQGPNYISANDTKRMELNRQLNSDRSKLLRELFSDDFFNNNGEVSAAQRRQYGDISRSKIDLLERVNDDYNDMTGQIRAAMGGITLPEDREKLALLEREKHADLATILSPGELADYEMRSSPITTMLRSRIGSFDATEAEFRAVYKVDQSISDQFAANGGMQGISPQIRGALGQQYSEQMSAALGPERYADFSRAMDRDYQQLTALGQRANLTPDVVAQAYNLRDSVSAESNRIYDDSSLALDQKRAALAALAQQTRNQLLAALGPTAGPAYVQTLDNSWLRAVENGSAVSFSGSPNGTMSNSSTGVTMFMGGSSPAYKRVQAQRPALSAPPAQAGGLIFRP